MTSPASTSKVAISLLVISFLIFNCWWFVFLPHQPDLLLSATTGNHSRRSFNFYQTKTSSISSGHCDISQGKWVPDTRPPLYTNDTCRYIQPPQNCMQNGRPDQGYLNWKWEPDDCELPRFNPAQFLDLMRGKKLMFIGDSIARNHMQALLCALSQAEDPQNLFSDNKDKEYKWLFSSYNFTMANVWSPFLVNHTLEEGLYKLYLDVPDKVWSSQLADYDMAIISTGYWYFRPCVYYLNDTMLGVNARSGLNLTTVKLVPVLRIVLESVLKYIVKEYRGITMLRTVTVDHFEHGSWNNGGACNRTVPFIQPDIWSSLPWMNTQINKVQIEEFEKAMAILNEPSRLKLLNVTYSAFLRPDGHPGAYRIRQPLEPANDCLHWCLPGPIDMWNQQVLYNLQHDSPESNTLH